jgi:hypothetical protein
MKNVYLFSKIVLIIVFFTTVKSSALPASVWHKGQMMLFNKVTLEGELSYNWKTEIVLLRQSDGRVRAFSATQVQQFGWFDYSFHKQRNFLVLPTLVNKQAKSAFFEIYMDGSLAVVRRLRKSHGLFKRLFNHPAYYNDQPSLAQTNDFFDYFVYDAGQLRAFDQFNLDIYEPLLTAYDEEMRQYIISHNINDHTLLGRLVLIDHYNFLVQHDPKTASARGAGYTQEPAPVSYP